MKKKLITDSKTRFSETVRDYDQYRPSYPPQLIDWIINTTKVKPPAMVVDLGCGTGIATRLFATRGFTTIGIDPNEDMLADAIKRGGAASYQKGDAQDSGLQNESVDLVISAQAFHWFDIRQTMTELRRIVRPNGFCCAFWNVREGTPFVKDYEHLLKQYSNDYQKTPKASETINIIKNFPIIKSAKEAQFPNSQEFDLAGLIGRAYSTSYVAHGVKDHDNFKQALADLFGKYQSQGKVTVVYKTLAICWKF